MVLQMSAVLLAVASTLPTSVAAPARPHSPPGTNITLEVPWRKLHSTLCSAGLEHPDRALIVLRKLGLKAVADIRLLDPEETAELRMELKQGGVTLSDRARIRRLSQRTINRPAFEESDAFFGLERPAPHLIPRASTPHASPPADGPERPRRLQQDGSGGISGETAALAVTGLLGVLSFVAQARASAAADRTQKDTEAARSVAETQRQERVQQAQGQMIRVGRWYGAPAANLHVCHSALPILEWLACLSAICAHQDTILRAMSYCLPLCVVQMSVFNRLEICTWGG